MQKIILVGPLSVRLNCGRQKKISDAEHVPRKPFQGYCYGSWLPRIEILPGLTELVAAIRGKPLIWWRPANGIDISSVWAIWHLAVHIRKVA
ncbi:hypothetical protein M0R72_20595 [Candidatus Pacearchaeota archaeon]|nr:hypothetical protein [Candidatus Pacearchaeota archaeon]